MKNEKRIEELLSELLHSSDQQKESMNEVVSILRMHTEYLKNISEHLKEVDDLRAEIKRFNAELEKVKKFVGM